VNATGGSNSKSIDVAYIPYACVQDFLEGEWIDLRTQWNGTFIRTCLHKKMSKTPQFSTTSGILGMYHMRVLLSIKEVGWLHCYGWTRH
jgi:hypothetical protein